MNLNNNEGWIKVPRSLLDDRVFSNPELLKVWLWCQLKSRHSEKSNYLTVNTGKGNTEVEIKQYQFLFGRNKASEELGLKPSKVRSLISKLTRLNYIKLKSFSHYSIVTVKQFTDNQCDTNNDSQPKTTKDNQQPTNDQPKTTKDTNNNVKNVNKDNNVKNVGEEKIAHSENNNPNISLNDEKDSKKKKSEAAKKEKEPQFGGGRPIRLRLYDSLLRINENAFANKPSQQNLDNLKICAQILKDFIKDIKQKQGEPYFSVTDNEIAELWDLTLDNLRPEIKQRYFNTRSLAKNLEDYLYEIKNGTHGKTGNPQQDRNTAFYKFMKNQDIGI